MMFRNGEGKINRYGFCVDTEKDAVVDSGTSLLKMKSGSGSMGNIECGNSFYLFLMGLASGIAVRYCSLSAETPELCGYCWASLVLPTESLACIYFISF